LRLVRAAARNARVFAAAGLAHRWLLRDEPARAVAGVARRLPGGVTRIAARPLDRLAGRSLSAAAYAALISRDNGRLRRTLRAASGGPVSRRTAERLADVAAATGHRREAAALADRSRPETGELIRARLAWSGGDLRAAVAALPADARGRRGRLRRRYLAELALLAPPAERGLPEDPAEHRLPAPPAEPEPTAAPAAAPAADGGRRAGPPRSGSDARAAATLTVLHIATSSLPHTRTSVTRRLHHLAAAGRDVGIDAHVATAPDYQLTVGRIGADRHVVVDGVDYHRLASSTATTADRRLAARIRRTADLVRELRPGVLHATAPYENGVVALAVRDRFGIPVVYEVPGRGPPQSIAAGTRSEPAETERATLLRAAETACLTAADAVVVPDQDTYSDAVSRGVPAARITIVRPGLPATYLRPPPDAAAQRRQMGFDDRTVVLTASTDWIDDAGLLLLVRALDALLIRSRRVRLVVFGHGSGVADARALADSFELQDKLFTPGAIPRGHAGLIHAVGDVVAVTPTQLPLRPGQHGVAEPIAAMAAGRPLVVSDLPALRELASSDGSWLVPAGDVGPIIDSVETLADDAALRAKLGGQSRDWLLQNRSWHASARVLRQLYAALRDG